MLKIYINIIMLINIAIKIQIKMNYDNRYLF